MAEYIKREEAMDVREKLIEILRKPIFPHELVDPTEAVADYLLDNGVTVQEWISVTDMLPKPFENVLVFRDGKISIDYHEENGWFAYDFNGKRVTHWMPLPEKPKGE